MDGLFPTSPLVPGLGDFGFMATVSVGVTYEDHQTDPTRSALGRVRTTNVAEIAN